MPMVMFLFFRKIRWILQNPFLGEDMYALGFYWEDMFVLSRGWMSCVLFFCVVDMCPA